MIVQRSYQAAGIPHKRIFYIPYLGIGLQTYARGISLHELIILRNELINAGKALLEQAIKAAGPALQEAYSSGLIPSTKNTGALAAYQLPDISFTNVIYQSRGRKISTDEIYLIDW